MVEVFYTQNAWKLAAAVVVVRGVLTLHEKSNGNYRLSYNSDVHCRRRVGRFFLSPANCCCLTHRSDCSSHFALLNFFLSHKLQWAATIFLHNEKPFTFFGCFTLFLFEFGEESSISASVKQSRHKHCAIAWKYLLNAFCLSLRRVLQYF